MADSTFTPDRMPILDSNGKTVGHMTREEMMREFNGMSDPANLPRPERRPEGAGPPEDGPK